MSHEIKSVKDMLAGVNAQMDQVQAQIDEARSLYTNDSHWQLELDRKQRELDEKRKRVKLMNDIDDMLEQRLQNQSP